VTPETIAIISVGVALATILLTRTWGLRGAMATLRERMAHLEGVMQGLREAIANNKAS